MSKFKRFTRPPHWVSCKFCKRKIRSIVNQAFLVKARPDWGCRTVYDVRRHLGPHPYEDTDGYCQDCTKMLNKGIS